MDIVERLRKPINEKEDYFIGRWPNEEAHTKDVVRLEAAAEIEQLRNGLEHIVEIYEHHVKTYDHVPSNLYLMAKIARETLKGSTDGHR